MTGIILLPPPRRLTGMSVEEALLSRRSIREFKGEAVRLVDLALILWATYGVNDPAEGLLTTPSAGATYPLRVYLVAGEKGVVDGEAYLEAGVYRYEPRRHVLVHVRSGDVRGELSRAALMQEYVAGAPVSIVLTAVYDETVKVYGRRGRERYVPMEAGHACENTYLMATALGYGAVAVGAFRDEDVLKAIGAGKGETPLYVVPIGVPVSRRVTGFDGLAEYFERARS
ncbi:SagB/ThcOx family dehydrogenase [Desulfurococcus mucosus]|uniref:SagB-type dehydrogenase domain protein n=1 Tax=Desulfurococcus mucosus (strain ATCC 35584 / DSM 2162 / JCM 9187 / O7/1) TaxID=765177 RepID=E8R8P4_DESM0|nr:SagB/ThcOx family dehydrogenase [Desulfurococcus mucosus]ADV64870.1 SagB-type dehydrogenase domain protein [Desulfurococcus mucosus DSM 2162]